MSPNKVVTGVATYGYLRSRRQAKPVVLAPKSTTCVCGTDTEISPCPANCPTRDTEETS